MSLQVPSNCIIAAAGNATRMCFEDGTWGEVNVLSCSSPDIDNILNEVNGKYNPTYILSLSAYFSPYM